MRPTAKQAASPASWPPEKDQIVTFESADGLRTGVVKEVRWGLVWRDFILDDGRVIPEHRVLDHPEPPVWRNPEEVTRAEREACETRLVSMAEAGLDPREKEQAFWAELNQYLAYTYLRFKHSRGKAPDAE